MALGGVFGYELDLNLLTVEEQDQVREQLATHARIEEIVRLGDVYRLLSPFEEDPSQPRISAWMHVLPDKSRAVVFGFLGSVSLSPRARREPPQQLTAPSGPARGWRCARPSDYYELVWKNPRVVLRGLDPTRTYRLSRDYSDVERDVPGAILLSAGLPNILLQDGASLFFELNAL